MRRIQNWLLVSDICQYTLYISQIHSTLSINMSNDIIILNEILFNYYRTVDCCDTERLIAIIQNS